MKFDIFEQLSEHEVPPIPVELDRQIHHRVNDSLLGVHVLEFVFQVIPYAALHFGQAIVGLLAVTLSGSFPHDRGDRTKRS